MTRYLACIILGALVAFFSGDVWALVYGPFAALAWWTWERVDPAPVVYRYLTPAELAAIVALLTWAAAEAHTVSREG